MKQALAFSLFILFSIQSFSQEKLFVFGQQPYKERNGGSFAKTNRLFSFSYGFPPLLEDGGYPSNHSMVSLSSFALGPAQFQFEFGIRDEIGIALSTIVAIQSRDVLWDLQNVGSLETTALGFGVIGTYHFNKFLPVERLDVYASAGVQGVLSVWHAVDGYAEYGDAATTAKAVAIGGVRYHFTSHFSAYIEAGHMALSRANLGITLRRN